MIGSLLGCDTMSVGTWHDMASHPKSLKSAVILLSQPPISYCLYYLVAGYREGWEEIQNCKALEGPTLRWGGQIIKQNL
jgi:hypothetical protein